MILNKLVRKFKLSRQLNVCLLCSQPIEVISEHENIVQTVPTTKPNKAELKERKRPPSKKHVLELEKLFSEHENLLPPQQSIPEKLLTYTTNTRPEYLYLISPDIAKKVVNYILPGLNIKVSHQIVAESNPGFGYIARELSEQGVPVVRLYEYYTEFQEILKKMIETNSTGKFELFNKDFFKIYICSGADKYDQGLRVASLLKGVPRKSWVDDPVMTVAGTLTDLSFLRYLVKSIVLQREIAMYGRIEIFAIMFPKDWARLTATQDDGFHMYRPWTILFQTFFEIKLLDKFPRKFFLPWPTDSTKKVKGFRKYDPDNMYLVQISMRKEFCLKAEEFMPFFCFIRTFLGVGNKIIIPTCEKWVPGCGIQLIAPKLNHEDYFDDMNIFTKFQELTPKQTVAVFKEITSLPGYHNSPFSDMIEQELIKSETISSDLHAAHKYKRTISNTDFELK